MPLGFSINNDDKWFGFGASDVSTSGGGFRAQAEEDEKKKMAAIDFSATGHGNPAGYTAASAWLQC